jgi:RimJ/RimL family protein N-acetyltransferase
MSSNSGHAGEIRTDRLVLRPPTVADVEQVYAISSDPRVWQHFPSGRPTSPTQTGALLARWIDNWREVGLAPWMARRHGEASIIGYGGSSLVAGSLWNISYRFVASEHGRGYATELARSAIRAADLVRPGLPIVASLLEHNTASARVAIKLGMTVTYRGPDATNPDPAAVRLIYATRPLSDAEVALLMRP